MFSRGDNMYRHYRLVNKRRFFFFLAFIFMVLFLVSMIISAGAVSEEAQSYKTIRVQKGDTLWKIASLHCTGDIRENIYKIRQINQIPQGIIYEGQVLLLP
jgi:uncharacterized membrane protein